MSAQTHGHRHSHVHVHADQHSRTQIKHSCRSFPLTYRFCWSYNTANFFWSQSKPFHFHQVYHFFQISISARQKFKHFVPLTPQLGQSASPEPVDLHAQALPYAVAASAAQSSAPGGVRGAGQVIALHRDPLGIVGGPRQIRRQRLPRQSALTFLAKVLSGK